MTYSTYSQRTKRTKIMIDPDINSNTINNIICSVSKAKNSANSANLLNHSYHRYNLRSIKSNVKNMINPYIGTESLNIQNPRIIKELRQCINKNYKSKNNDFIHSINYYHDPKENIINDNVYNIYASNSTTIIEIADYDKYVEFKYKKSNKYLHQLIEDFTNTNIKVIVIWYLHYLTDYYPILITEHESEASDKNKQIEYNEKWLYNISTPINSSWISASKTRNYLMDDPLIDYLEYNQIYEIDDLKNIKNNKKRKYSESSIVSDIEKKPTFLSAILNNGIQFENKIILDLMEKYPNQIVKILDIGTYDEITREKLKDPIYFHITQDMIKKGVPIIYQGVLHNSKNKSYGLPDLIVRADYINKIIDEEIDIDLTKLKATNQYPYYIIDIKNSNMHLSARADTLLNYNNVKPYKGQIAIYHQSLSDIQEYDTQRAFILASKWTRKQKDTVYQCSNPFDRLGIIDFESNDISYIDSSNSAIEWNKLIRNPDNDLNCLEPNNPNLYPNMCNSTDGKFRKVKKFLAEKNHEITNIWMCGTKHRANAIANGCTKWSDPNVDSNVLGFNGKNAKILDLILKINRSKSVKLSDKIHPKQINSYLNGWRDRNKLAFYVDFETLNSTAFLPREYTDLEINNPNANDIIFMIGIGHSYQNNWSYKCYIADDLSDQSQLKIINQMTNHIRDISANHGFKSTADVNVYHWSNFEPMILAKACSKHNIIMPIIQWIDILKMFHEEPIIIKGALNFSLKSVGKALYNLGLIKTIWSESDNVTNGLDAMFQAYLIYNDHNDHCKDRFKQEMKSIQSYNEIDCKIMWEILDALAKIL
jgi:hypothetical protein